MADIARMADVDISTVSRALADSPKVTEETKARIRQIVEDTGYVVNHGARMLRNKPSGQMLVMLPNIAATFFPEVVLGIEDRLQEEGFNVVVGSTRNDKEREDSLARQLLTGAADGVILMTGHLPSELEALPQYDRRVVGVSRAIDNNGIPQVNIDNEAAASTATAHLISLGHSSIAHLAGPAGSPTFRARADGYTSMMQASGLTHNVSTIASNRFNRDAGMDSMRRLLAEKNRPTAVLCASDEMAMGAMQIAREAGLSIPGDIAFIGFDDIAFSSVVTPPLSTIRIPRYDMGVMGAQMLLCNLDLDQAKPDSVVMPHELISRESSGA